jgi:hypothetical protein
VNDLLNTPQRSSLTNVLRMLEERLRQAQAWLPGADETGLLYHHSLRLSQEQQELAARIIAMALDEIAQVSREFDLAPREDDLAAVIGAGMSLVWADLVDTRSDKLNRFGAVDPRLAQQLDPHLDRLIELALLLSSLVRGKSIEQPLDETPRQNFTEVRG